MTYLGQPLLRCGRGDAGSPWGIQGVIERIIPDPSKSGTPLRAGVMLEEAPPTQMLHYPACEFLKPFKSYETIVGGGHAQLSRHRQLRCSTAQPVIF